VLVGAEVDVLVVRVEDSEIVETEVLIDTLVLVEEELLVVEVVELEDTVGKQEQALLTLLATFPVHAATA
jgi:hypothetical protein